MAVQYDEIAERYNKVKSSFIITRHYHIISYTMQRLLGDISGKSVLDLACGEGLYTREFAQMGASRVVGVDISERMLSLAIEREALAPLGIEYTHSAAQDLGKIGDFDVVAAVFLLHYAQTREQLCKMCKTAFDNLRPGQRFVTVANDFEIKGFDYPASDGFKKYGYGIRASSVPLQEGSVMTITLAGDGEEVHYDGYYFSREIYEWALTAAGFRTINWHKLLLPPEVERADGRDFWELFTETSPGIIIECYK